MRNRVRPTSGSFLTLTRSASLLLMLGVILLTIWNLRRQDAPLPMQQPLPPAQHNLPPQTATKPPARQPGQPALQSHAEEMDAFREEAQLITDRSTTIHPTEMPAYQRLLKWVAHDSLATLQNDAQSISFHELVHHPSKYRGEVVHVKLGIRRVLDCTPQGEPGKLYELWGWPTESTGWLYVVVTPELPPGVEIGETVEATVDVYGYFFKLQGYYPANAKPGSRALFAPLIVGRLRFDQRPVVVAELPRWWYLVIGLGVALSIGTTIYRLVAQYRSRKRGKSLLTAGSTTPSEPLPAESLDSDVDSDLSVDEVRPTPDDAFDWLK